MEIMGLFHCLVLVGSHVFLAWVELLVLEALVRKSTLETLEGLYREQSDYGFMTSNHEVESLVEG